MLPRLLRSLSEGSAAHGSPWVPVCLRSASTDCHANLALEELLLRASLLRHSADADAAALSSSPSTPIEALRATAPQSTPLTLPSTGGPAPVRGPPMVCLSYINIPCVVVGRNQNVFREAAVARMHVGCPSMRHGLSAGEGLGVADVAEASGERPMLARRTSGGGAVFHNSGNVNFGLYTHRDDYDPELTIQLLRCMLEITYRLAPGRLTTTKRHDLFLDGKKITGSAMRVGKHTALHHFTLLVNTRREDMHGWLAPAGHYRSFATAAVDSIRSPVTTLSDAIDGFDDSPHAVQGRMLRFIHTYGWPVFAHWQRRKRALRAAFDPAEEVRRTLAWLPAGDGVAGGETLTLTVPQQQHELCGTRLLHPLEDGASLPLPQQQQQQQQQQQVEEVAVTDIPYEALLAAHFVYSPGDRPQRGDEPTVAALVAKHKSPVWLIHEPGMGRFVTAVAVAAADLHWLVTACCSACAGTDGGHGEDDASASSALAVSGLLPPGAMTKGAALVLHTTVEYGKIALVGLTAEVTEKGAEADGPTTPPRPGSDARGPEGEPPEKDISLIGAVLDAALHGMPLVDLLMHCDGSEALANRFTTAVQGHGAAALCRLAPDNAEAVAEACGGGDAAAAAAAVERLAVQLAMEWATANGFVQRRG